MPMLGAQNGPGWTLGFVPTPAQWQSEWVSKADATAVVQPQVVSIGTVPGSANAVTWPEPFVNGAGAQTPPTFVTATPMASSSSSPGAGATYSIGGVTATGCVLYVGAGGSATQTWLVRGEL